MSDESKFQENISFYESRFGDLLISEYISQRHFTHLMKEMNDRHFTLAIKDTTYSTIKRALAEQHKGSRSGVW